MQRLQDQNDELLIEKESLRQQLATFILASYQHQQQQNSNQQTSQQQQQTLLTTTTAANQSSIFSSSSFTPESIIMAPTDEIMMMIESGGILPKFPSITATTTTTTGRSKKRKRRRRRKKNKNKTTTPNNDNEQIEMNTTVNVQIDNNNNNDMNHNHDDKDKKQDNIVDTSMSSDNISTKTNPKTEIKPMMNNTGRLTEEDQSSTFSTITTHGDDFDEDDDLDMDDDMDIEDDYDDFHHQTELVSSWTLKQRHKRIKQPNSNMYEEAVEEEGKLDDLDDDDDDDDDDNLQTLIQNHPSTTYIRSLSDEINFDLSRPIFANQPDQSSLEKNLQMILNQIIQDNHSIKENHNDVDNDFSSRIFSNDNDNEMILKRALRRIENALKQIDNNNSNDDQLMVVDKQQSSSVSQFDHNNNPNP